MASNERRRSTDRRGRLEAAPFTYCVTKDGRVRIAWGGRVVTTIAGGPARRLVDAMANASQGHRQLLLAKATGNFKHGNERERHPHR